MKDKELDVHAQHKTRCLAIGLIVTSLLSCGNIFTLLEAIFALIGNTRGEDGWRGWKVGVRITMIIGLLVSILSAIASPVLSIYCFVLYATYAHKTYIEGNLIVYACLCIVFFVSCIINACFCKRTSTAYCNIYMDPPMYAPAPVYNPPVVYMQQPQPVITYAMPPVAVAVQAPTVVVQQQFHY